MSEQDARQFDQDPREHAERLLTLLHLQRNLYVQLRRLSDQQTQIISSDKPDRLLALLTARQKLVNQLTEINQQLAPFRQRWQEICNSLPDRCRQEAQKVLNEVRQILEGILLSDEADQKKLSARTADVARQIGVAATGKRAHALYQDQTAGKGQNLLDAQS